jgi:ketosteroid isomerase-like protein
MEKLPEFFSPAITYSRPGFPVISGIDGLDHFYREARQVRKGVHTINEILTERDILVCRGRFAGEMMSGNQVETDFADFYRLEDGRIIERRTYFFASCV